ncbi:hypothetical protein E4U38_006734 [Claviceps purpurea]|nr:hypothetical protein E4U38_006734 [Claviceps purpurea]
MEGNGAANGPMFEPQDVDTRVLDDVTGEPTEPRTYLLSTYTRGHPRGRPPGAVIAERIIQVSAIPRWPESSPGGTAYVIPIGGLPEEDVERPWDVLQYGNRLFGGGEYKARSAILGGTEVTIRKSACSGIVHCRHLAPELLQPAIYTNLDAYWGALERVRIRTTQNFATQGRQEAICWAWSIKKDYDEKKACKKAPHGQGDTCIPGVHSNEAPQGSRANSWVACALASAGGRSRRGDNHQKQWIPSKFDTFLSEIRQIITSTQQLPCNDNNCHVVDRIDRKAKTCKFGHDLSGPGEMVKVEHCPQNTELRPFQHSVHYDDWLDSNGAATADEVTPHLVNHGYFGHLISRSNAIDRPHGSSREGVEHEWRTLHQGPNRYIQSVISTGDDFLAICFTQSQAELWGQIVLVLARAYMSSQTAVAYEALFRELFTCLNACRVVVQWKHIHGEGLYGVTMDQDAAAIKGDGALKPWIDHKKTSYISCGLSQAHTLMPPLVWNALSTDTNGVESLHQQSYKAGGRYTPMLSAIRS